RARLAEHLLPRATVATPNVAEACELTGLNRDAGQEELARAVLALGPDAVVVTGGHTREGADVLVEGDADALKIEGPRVREGASHGSGCTHSSTIAALLARGESIPDAAVAAKAIATEAVADGLRGLGAGAGPVDVFALASRDEPDPQA